MAAAPSMLDDLGVDRKTFTCPECLEAGETRTFDRPQALGAHRHSAHGVAGVSKPRAKPKAKAKKAKAKSARKAKRVEVPAVSLAPVPPEHLNEREATAFQLGSLQTLLAAVEEGRLDPPGQIFLDAMQAEVEHHEWILAAE